MSNTNNTSYRSNINKSKHLLQNIENVLRKGGPGSKNSGNNKPEVPELPVPPLPGTKTPNKKIITLGNNINTGNSIITNKTKLNRKQFGPIKARGIINNKPVPGPVPPPPPPPPPGPVPPPPGPVPPPPPPPGPVPPPPPPPGLKKNIKIKSVVSNVNTTKKKINNIKNNKRNIKSLPTPVIPKPTPPPQPIPVKKKPTEAEIEAFKKRPGQWQKILAMWEEEKKTKGLDAHTGIQPQFVKNKVAELMAQEQEQKGGSRRRRTRKNRRNK